VLLANPERVASEGWLAFASAIWIYMTPMSPKPSMHDIMAGFWQPNPSDTTIGFKLGFGSTINVINGKEECGKTNLKATWRTSYYNALINFFKVPTSSTEDPTCTS